MPSHCFREVELLNVPNKFIGHRLFEIRCVELYDLGERIHVGFGNTAAHASSFSFCGKLLPKDVAFQSPAEVVLNDRLHDIQTHCTRFNDIKLVRIAVVSHWFREEDDVSAIGHLFTGSFLGSL